MDIKKYDRKKAVAYAEKWALSRNTAYYDFSNAALGGDCTNFVSQCLFAGCGAMNYLKVFGWYYIDANRRAPSWTGVQYLYNFLVKNTGAGPSGTEIPLSQAQPGDIIQLSFDDKVFSHSLIVLTKEEEILIACHSYDALFKNLNEYTYKKLRVIQIDGYR